MSGRRLAVALPPLRQSTPPPPPPPPPPLVDPFDICDSPSLTSLRSSDFERRPKYRCCCRLMHLRTATFLIGLTDTLGMSAAFGRGLHLGLSMQHNPMAIAWFVISSLLFVLGFLCTLSMFYGIWRESYLWIVPKLVMKISSIILYSGATIGLVYMMMEHSQYLLDLVAEQVMKSDYEAARVALRVGGGGLAVAFLLMALIHVWFFYVLCRCYKYLKDRYFWKKSRLVECNQGHIGALASAQSDSSLPRYSSSLSQNFSNAATGNSSRNGTIRRSDSNEVDQTCQTAPFAKRASQSLELRTFGSSSSSARNQRDSRQGLSQSASDRELLLWKHFNQSHI